VFYRYTKAGARVAVDQDGLYQDEALFLLGGSPTLNELPLELLRTDGVITLGMNNVPCVFKPNLWICADKPQCFSPHIHASPEIAKYTMISRRDLVVPGTGKKMREFPNMYFFGATEKFTAANFLDPHRDLAWWRSVFPMALQLAHRLGFRKVFLVGCGFHMNKAPGKQYAWNTTLTSDQAQYSHNTYSKDVARLKVLMPTFQRHRFEVVSCTPGSAANSVLPYVPLEEAVREVVSVKPRQADTTTLIHSSQLKHLAKKAAEAKPQPVGAR
jgi:hypothetical protein